MYRMRVALVHDYFTQLGGAERVVGMLHDILEPSIVAAAVVDRRLLPPGLAARDVRSSWLQPLLRAGAPLASLAPLLPAAFEGLRLDGVDLVVSSTSAFAHHVRAPSGARHVAYVHTPPRFIWQTDEYFREHRAQQRLLGPALAWFRRSDRRAVARVDRLIANSEHTAARLRRIHGRDSTVVHPPIDVRAFAAERRTIGPLPRRGQAAAVQAARPRHRGGRPDRGRPRRHRQRPGPRPPATARGTRHPLPGTAPGRGTWRGRWQPARACSCPAARTSG